MPRLRLRQLAKARDAAGGRPTDDACARAGAGDLAASNAAGHFRLTLLVGGERPHGDAEPYAESTWEVDGAGDSSIQGYATSMSVNKGQTISFKIKSTTSNYHIDILRESCDRNCLRAAVANLRDRF